MKTRLFWILLLITAQFGLAQKWQWGLHGGVGLSGEQQKLTQTTVRISGVGTIDGTQKTLLEPSVLVGAWVERKLGERWALTSAIQYHWLSHIEQYTSYIIGPSGNITNHEKNENRLQQSALEAPVGGRFYFQRPSRKWRVFLGAQLIPTWITDGALTFLSYQNNIFNTGPNIYGSSYHLDFDATYVQNQPIQLGYGAEIGFSKGPFAFALIKQWSFRPERLDYYNSYGCRGGCDFFDPDYNGFYQTRLLENTNLRLQYRIN